MRFKDLARGSAIAAVMGVSFAVVGTRAGAAEDPKPYTVIDGKVDKGTYNGFRRFHSICNTCHGQGGGGSSFAPNLTESLTRLSYDDFLTVVAQGRESNLGGAERVMPSFANNPDVMEYIDDIYSYLKARSDHKIGPTRPERIEEPQPKG